MHNESRRRQYSKQPVHWYRCKINAMAKTQYWKPTLKGLQNNSTYIFYCWQIFIPSICWKLDRNVQTWIQDLLIQDQDQDSAVSRPRPRPRLSSFKTKTKTKTSMSKTETQDLQDQYWQSIIGMNCDKQKVMASRKSSIPVVAHSKQKTSYYV